MPPGPLTMGLKARATLFHKELALIEQTKTS